MIWGSLSTRREGKGLLQNAEKTRRGGPRALPAGPCHMRKNVRRIRTICEITEHFLDSRLLRPGGASPSPANRDRLLCAFCNAPLICFGAWGSKTPIPGKSDCETGRIAIYWGIRAKHDEIARKKVLRLSWRTPLRPLRERLCRERQSAPPGLAGELHRHRPAGLPGLQQSAGGKLRPGSGARSHGRRRYPAAAVTAKPVYQG